MANGNLVIVLLNTKDSKNQWRSGSSLYTEGVLELPYSPPADGKWSGHGMVIVGYDDAGYGKYNGAGAFKVRNSWGSSWGDGGYWYLPYSVVDAAANQSRGNTFPFGYDDNWVYVSAVSHN